MSETIKTFQSFGDYAKKIYKETKDNKSENDGGFLVPTKISIPVNKWENLKQRFLPYWLQKIFPVKTKEVNFRKLLTERLKEKEMLG